MNKTAEELVSEMLLDNYIANMASINKSKLDAEVKKNRENTFKNIGINEQDPKWNNYTAEKNNAIAHKAKEAAYIINSNSIDRKTYTSNNCKGGMSYYHFNGTQYCWPLNDSYSFRPLYFEDDNKRIYYHPYNSDHCTTEKMDFFQINENFFKCDGKCHKNIKDDTTSYKCVFKSGEYINLKKLFLFLYLFLLFEMI